MINRRLLLLHIFFILILLINGFHYLVLSFADLSPVFSLSPVWSSIGLFWLIAFSVAYFTVKPIGSRGTAGLLEFPVALFSYSAAKICFIVSGIGVLLHVHAKTSLPGYDELTCLSSIRFLWLDSNPSELSTHLRISSALGHIMVWFCAPGLVISSVNYIRAQGVYKWGWLLLFCLFMVPGFLYSLFLGARGPMLALLIVASFGAFVSPLYSHFSWSTVLRGISLLLLAVVVAAGFAISVSNDRIQQCGNSPQTKTSDYLSGYEDEIPVSVLESSSSSGSEQLIALYLNHGLFNFAQVATTGEARGNVVYRKSTWFLSRLGIVEAEPAYGPRRYGAGGIGLVGSIYHDYGIKGVMIGGAVIGCCLGMILLLLGRNTFFDAVGLASFVTLYFAVSLSNIFLFLGVMVTPFILFALGAVFIPSAIIFGRVKA